MDTTKRAMLGQAVMQALDGIAVSAVFIYGSVALGTDHAGSDLDTFILLTDDIEARRRRQVRADFCELQVSLGYQPDTKHPVELFSVGAAAAALDIVEVVAIAGSLAALPINGDEREVLGALSGPRLLVWGGYDLDRLTARAMRLARLV